MSENDKELTVDSTPLAAYLITEGFTMIDTTPVNEKGQIYFIFKNDSIRLAEAIHDFETLRAVASASILLRNYQDLVRRVLRELK